MDQSKSENVFFLSPLGQQARVEFADNLFKIYSHLTEKNGKIIASINLSKSSMQTLIGILPVLQNSMQIIEYDMKGKVDKDSIHNSAGIVGSILPTDKEYNRVLIDSSGIFKTFLTVSTWNQKVYIWLKKYFSTVDRNNPNVMVDCVCNGGTLFNNVDCVALSQFVNSKI